MIVYATSAFAVIAGAMYFFTQTQTKQQVTVSKNKEVKASEFDKLSEDQKRAVLAQTYWAGYGFQMRDKGGDNYWMTYPEDFASSALAITVRAAIGTQTSCAHQPFHCCGPRPHHTHAHCLYTRPSHHVCTTRATFTGIT